MAKNIGFEEAMAKLEQNASALKSGNLSIEDSVKVYEESIDYYNFCADFLKNARQKIEIYRPESGKTEEFGEV